MEVWSLSGFFQFFQCLCIYKCRISQFIYYDVLKLKDCLKASDDFFPDDVLDRKLS